MKSIKLIIVLVAIYLPFSGFSQDSYSYSDGYSNEINTSVKTVNNSEAFVKTQENKLKEQINHFLAGNIEYPYDARENGEEGVVRGVIILDIHNNTAVLKTAKGNLQVLATALIQAFEKLDIMDFVPNNYQGKTSIPVRITFELEE